MKNPLLKLHREAHSLKLSAHEKHIMHARIMERVGASVLPPVRSRTGLSYFFMPQFAMSFAAVVVIVLGGTTALAAQGSLPGEPLYAVKTKVSEPIRGALAFSVEDKIKFHDDVVQTRVEEAEVLASEDKLDASLTETISANIEDHLSRGQELKQKFEQDHPENHTVLASNDVSITAHSDVLEQLGQESSSTPTRENAGAIAMRVRPSRSGARIEMAQATLAMAKTAAPTAPQPMAMMAMSAEDVSATSVPESTEGESRSKNASRARTVSLKQADSAGEQTSRNRKGSSDSSAALESGARATTTLLQLRTVVADMGDKIDADTLVRLNARFAEIDTLIAEGNAAVSADDIRTARDMFRQALDREVTLSTFIKAQQKFDGGILGHLLRDEDSGGSDE